MRETKRPKFAINRQPICPDRVRRIGGQGFCFIPHRFLRDGFFASLGQHELLLYFFLVLAGDRNGISFYHCDRICDLLRIEPELYLRARNQLISKSLLAFDGARFQVLELPPRPHLDPSPALVSDEDFEGSDPATIRQLIHASLAQTSEDV